MNRKEGKLFQSRSGNESSFTAKMHFFPIPFWPMLNGIALIHQFSFQQWFSRNIPIDEILNPPRVYEKFQVFDWSDLTSQPCNSWWICLFPNMNATCILNHSHIPVWHINQDWYPVVLFIAQQMWVIHI